MEYDYDFYQQAWRLWTREIFPRLTGLLYPDAMAIAKTCLEDWLALIKPEASAVCKMADAGRSIYAEIHVPVNDEIHVYPLYGGPYTRIKITASALLPNLEASVNNGSKPYHQK